MLIIPFLILCFHRTYYLLTYYKMLIICLSSWEYKLHKGRCFFLLSFPNTQNNDQNKVGDQYYLQNKFLQYQNIRNNCTHLTCQQSNAQNSPSHAATVHELWTSKYSSWIQKRQRNQRSNCQHPLDHRKSKGIPENSYFCFTD